MNEQEPSTIVDILLHMVVVVVVVMVSFRW
jgi:hypothetical protein